MDERDVVRGLVAKLIEAVEATLDRSAAVREALDELLRSGYEPRLILLADAAARAETSDAADADDEAANEDPRADATADADEDEEAEPEADLRYELTKLDKDFLRMVRIQSEGG